MPQARNHFNDSVSESGKIASEVISSAPITITSRCLSTSAARDEVEEFPAAQGAHATACSPTHNGRAKSLVHNLKKSCKSGNTEHGIATKPNDGRLCLCRV